MIYYQMYNAENGDCVLEKLPDATILVTREDLLDLLRGNPESMRGDFYYESLIDSWLTHYLKLDGNKGITL